MSRKHNCPKRGRRSKSNYPSRLTKRGLTKAPKMPTLETLQSRQLDKDGHLKAEYLWGEHGDD